MLRRHFAKHPVKDELDNVKILYVFPFMLLGEFIFGYILVHFC
jgi:hypothetical protein